MESPTLLENLKDLPPLVIGAGLVALIFIAAGIRLLIRKQPAHLTAFSGEAGSVLVSRKAIQELIQQACMVDDWVEEATPRIHFSNGKVHTHVELRLASSENLKETTERIQYRITELLKKSLNFDQIGDIKIVVTSFEQDISEQHIEFPPLESESSPSDTLEKQNNSKQLEPEPSSEDSPQEDSEPTKKDPSND